MKTKKVFAESLKTDVLLRRKLGEDQKKRSSPKTEVFFPRKLGEDQKKGLPQNLKCFFF